MTLANVLVATDFGDASMEAARTGLVLAEKLGGKVNLLHVFQRTADGRDASEARRQALEALHELAVLYEGSRAFGSYTALAGEPASAIVEFALETRADMIVIGVNGGLGAKSELVGGTAETVLRNARCPVLVVRPSELSLLANAESRRSGKA